MTTFQIAYNVTLGVMTVLSLALTIISVVGYKRTKNSKLLLVTLAFLSFFSKGLWLSYNSYVSPIDIDFSFWLPVLVLDNIILVSFYLTCLKR